VENFSEIVTIVNSDGTLRYASPAWEQVLGYVPVEAIGTLNVPTERKEAEDLHEK
jgi:PAS domain-containing protein